ARAARAQGSKDATEGRKRRGKGGRGKGVEALNESRDQILSRIAALSGAEPAGEGDQIPRAVPRDFEDVDYDQGNPISMPAVSLDDKEVQSIIRHSHKRRGKRGGKGKGKEE
ncbi:MAG: hypothetical protein K6A65_06420, partial [Succinivibrionaceae bacterium]|nr:hypothetical protein [Succinivibrionaceae bacterium]